MARQRTLVIIKPDGVMKGVSDEIKRRYRETGFEIVNQIKLSLNRAAAKRLYQDHKGQFYFEGLVLAMSSGRCEVLILEGENAIEEVRKLNGATDPTKAEPGTIRKDFQSAGGPFNTVHSSDSQKSFERECKILWSLPY